MREKSFLKHAAVYALGDLLVMAAGFVLLPIYARRLSVSEFGVLEVLERLAEVAAICLLLRGIPLATFAHFKQARDEDSRCRVLGSGLLLALAAAVGGAVVLAVAAGPVCGCLAVANGTLVWLAVTATLLDGVSVVVQATNQARQESSFFVFVSLGQFVTRVALCILFVVGLGWGAWGVLLAAVLRSGLFASVLVVREWRRGLLWPNRNELREMAAFVLPFLPIGLCAFVLNSGDRFFLVRQPGGQGEVGIYGLGYKLAALVGLFTVTPLYRVWSARLYDAAERSDAPRVFGEMATRILGAYLAVGLALCLFQDEVIRIFAGTAFARAAVIVAPVVLACGFFSASTLIESVFYVKRRTGLKSWIALASTAVILVAYATLIPAYGPLGAALATLIGFVFHAALTWVVAQRVFWVRYEFGRLTVLLGLAVSLWLVSRGLGVGPVQVVGKVVLWLLWPTTLWLTGTFTKVEKQWACEVSRAISARLGGLARQRMPGLLSRIGRSP